MKRKKRVNNPNSVTDTQLAICIDSCIIKRSEHYLKARDIERNDPANISEILYHERQAKDWETLTIQFLNFVKHDGVYRSTELVDGVIKHHYLVQYKLDKFIFSFNVDESCIDPAEAIDIKGNLPAYVKCDHKLIPWDICNVMLYLLRTQGRCQTPSAKS